MELNMNVEEEENMDIQVRNSEITNFLLQNEGDGEFPQPPSKIQKESEKTLKTEQMKLIVDFKQRVLEFISIYLEENKSVKEILKVGRHLAGAMRVANLDGCKILFDRLKSVLSKITKNTELKLGKLSLGELESDMGELLSDLIKSNSRNSEGFRMMLWMEIKLFLHKFPKHRPFVIGVLKTLMKIHFRHKKNTLKLSMFSDLFERYPHLALMLLKKITKYSLNTHNGGAKTEFLRLEALKLLGTVIKRIHSCAKSDTDFASSFVEYYPILFNYTKTCLSLHKTWKKKMGTLIQCLYAFIAGSKSIIHVNAQMVHESGEEIKKILEKIIEEDKTLTNLKGKLRELNNLLKY